MIVPEKMKCNSCMNDAFRASETQFLSASKRFQKALNGKFLQFLRHFQSIAYQKC